MERKAYDTDLTNEQKSIIQPLIQPEKKRHNQNHPRKHNYREILNAILYVCRTGYQ